jgi:tetratricopeptide (TPR) repeat protein
MTLRSLPVCLVLVVSAAFVSACRDRSSTAVGVATVSAAAGRAEDPSCRRALAPLSGGGELARQIATLQSRAAPGPLRAAALEQLGYAFVARARLANDPGLYDAALDAAGCLATENPTSAEASLLRGHVLHQQHRFREAEAVARTVVAARGSALDYGLLGDALMEQGRLDEAGRAWQTMIDLKPFYQSYTRAAHLRWLRGDLDGAEQTMRLALSAASPRDPEAGSWARTRLAYYQLQRGRVQQAADECDLVLRERADYAPALIVRGRVHLAQGRVADAVDVLRRAARLDPLPEPQWLLADALRLAGDGDEATRLEADLEREGRLRDPRTLSLFLATRGRATADAIALAERELGARADVFTHDTLAWALASGGRLKEARAHMTLALAEGTLDARLFLHAASLAHAAGQPAEARRWLRRARPLAATLLPSERDLLAALEAGNG